MAKAKQSKVRTVMVTLELETDVPLSNLSSKKNWQKLVGPLNYVRQVTATVAQPVKAK